MMTPRKQHMTIRMLKRAARLRREHGMALLFTLCILSMALITAMIFSSSASTGRKVAAAYVDTTSARILADGAVTRAILALMESNNAAYVCSNYKTVPPNGNANDYSNDWIWKMEKTGVFSFNDGPLRFDKTTYYNRDDSRCPSWEYVYTKNNYGFSKTATECIAGRYAYVAIGMNDQLNPNAIGRRNYGDFNNELFQKRLGRWTCEPQFNFKSNRNNWDYTLVVSPSQISSKYPTDGWTDIDLFINDLTGGGGSASDKQLKMMADQYFDVSLQGEYNKFRTDGQAIGDLTQHGLGTNEAFRFPLIRNDWESISVDAVKGAIPWFSKASGQANPNQTIANLINYNASINRPPVTDNDNWISGNPTYTGNKRTAYINEALADVSVGGNLGIRLSERYLEDPSNPTSWKWRVWYSGCNYSHEITINVETVNMYPSTGGSDGTINVQPPVLIGEISYEYWNPNGDNPGSWSSETTRFDASTAWEIVESGNPAGYKVYTFMLDNSSIGNVTTPKRDGYDRPMGHEADFYEHMMVRNVKVSLERVILRDYAGRNADLALMPTQLQNGNTFSLGSGAVVAGPGDFSKHFYFDTQVNDPRFNLGRDQWSIAFAEQESGVNATIGGRNNTINLGSYHDNEKQTDPAYAGNDSISTAYIRHGQMISLWELGAIHRGAPWQTINLKCASAKGVGMDRYDFGDGHLLDQIALAEANRIEEPIIGMINLNCVATFGGSSAPFAFKSLFTEFPVYQTYANMNSGSSTGTIRGDAVDSDKTGNLDADAYAKDLSEAVTYAISQGNNPRRTAVFPTAYGSGNQMEKIIPKNVPDAQAEEIFSRVVNLLKWNKQKTKRATVLVLAQSIKDVGVENGTLTLERNMPEKDIDFLRDAGFLAYSSGNTSTKSTLPTGMTAAGIRSSFEKRNVAYKQYDNFYDQITGEAKVLVRLEWDESANDNKGAWKVTRKEYEE